MNDLQLAAQQALEAIEALEGLSDWEERVFGKICDKLRAALTRPQDPVAYNGWVLREVLFDNGEPVGHREPTKAEPQVVDLEWPLERLVDRCNQSNDSSNWDETIAAEAALERLYRARKADDETIEVCPYCGEKRHSFSCCGEVHFVEMSLKDWEDGKELP